MHFCGATARLPGVDVMSGRSACHTNPSPLHRENVLICREAGEPAPTAHESELGVLCAAPDRPSQRLTRTESALYG